jgi:hypothetical protein
MTSTSGFGQPGLAEIMCEARSLVSNIQTVDKCSERILKKGFSLSEKIDTMKEVCVYRIRRAKTHSIAVSGGNSRSLQYCSKSTTHSHRPLVAAGESTNSVCLDLIFGPTKPFYRQLRDENRELKCTLEEHQNVLDILMTQHRDQIRQLMNVSRWQHLAMQAVDGENNKVSTICFAAQTHRTVSAFRRS